MSSLLNKLLGRDTPKAIEQEIYYPDFDAARKHISDASYEDPELCRMIAEKTRIYREKLSQTPVDLNAAQSFLLSVIQKILVEDKTTTLNVLDLGGACGAHYFEIKRLLPKNVGLKWMVIETAEMVRAASQIEKETSELFFCSELDQTDLKPQLIHSSSTLQYVPQPYVLIEQLKKTGTEWMFFNRMMFNTGKNDLITIQQSQMADNGPGPMPVNFTNKLIRYPHTNMSYSRFNQAFLPEYKPEWIFDEPSGNISKGEQNFIGKGMLFRKV